MTVPFARMLHGLALAAFVATCPPAAAEEEARRIVSIGGSVTEIIHALGEGDRLVARDSTSLHPESVAALPDVGYMRALSPEGVLSVDPDLIVMLEGAGPPEAIEVLKRASVPVVTVPESFDRSGVLAKIEIIGQALGAEARAAELAGEVEAAITQAEASAHDSGGEPAVMFVLSVQDGRIMASGTGTAADGIIAMAGARNAVTGFEGYRQLTDEAIIEAAPDYILMMDHSGGLDVPAEALVALPAIASTPAGAGGRVIRMDGSYLLGFGPRTASAVRDLAAALHGG